MRVTEALFLKDYIRNCAIECILKFTHKLKSNTVGLWLRIALSRLLLNRQSELLEDI